jgi:hypothetical protein
MTANDAADAEAMPQVREQEHAERDQQADQPLVFPDLQPSGDGTDNTLSAAVLGEVADDSSEMKLTGKSLMFIGSPFPSGQLHGRAPDDS